MANGMNLDKPIPGPANRFADGQPVAIEVEVTAVAVELPNLSKRIEWFDTWEEKTATNQRLAIRDREYYDNNQWTDEEKRILKGRKQPILTKNKIARKVNYVLGEEIRKRVDPEALPRTPQHTDSARIATDALRFVEEEQDFDSVRSSVLKNMLIEGYGGAIKSLDYDSTGDVVHKLKHIEWDRLFYDPHSRCAHFSDAKYLGIVRWADLDDAVTDYPEYASEISAAVTSGETGGFTDTSEDAPRRHQWYDKSRHRVKIIEMYFRIGKDWYRSDFTQGADLGPGENGSPERTEYLDELGEHSLCPLLMESCYVDRDGMRYGMVRQLISPQDEINKRSSKALHILNTMRVVAEKDVIPNPQTFMSELAKPDGFAEANPGRLKDGTVQIFKDNDLAQGQLQMLQEAKQDIDSIGPSSSTLPELPQGASGRAFIARQQAASQELGTVFDQLRHWTLRTFKMDWLCVRHWWTAEKWLRVRDDKEITGHRFVALNRQMSRAQRLQELLEEGIPLEDAMAAAAGDLAPRVMADVNERIGQEQQQAQQAQAMAQQAQAQGVPPEQIGPLPAPLQGPELQQRIVALISSHANMREPVTINQVDRMMIDIIINDAPETSVIEQEEFGKLVDMMPAVMQAAQQLGRMDLVMKMTKMIVQASQLRNKREILEDIDEQPQQDPQQAQMQQIHMQMQMQQMQAQIAALQSQAQMNQARAAKTMADAQALQMTTPPDVEKTQAETMKIAAEAGIAAAGG